MGESDNEDRIDGGETNGFHGQTRAKWEEGPLDGPCSIQGPACLRTCISKFNRLVNEFTESHLHSFQRVGRSFFNFIVLG